MNPVQAAALGIMEFLYKFYSAKSDAESALQESELTHVQKRVSEAIQTQVDQAVLAERERINRGIMELIGHFQSECPSPMLAAEITGALVKAQRIIQPTQEEQT